MLTFWKKISLPPRKTFSLKFCRGIRKLQKPDNVALNDICDSKTKSPHVPVMVKEVIKNLDLKEGDLFLDMTFGAGGHSRALLEEIPHLQVFALDRDPTVLKFISELQVDYPGQVLPLTGKFSDLPYVLENYFVKDNTFDGILFDLGCSSMQLDTAERGFSFSRDGPLDMRMGSDEDLTAADVLAYIEEADLKKIIRIYGGERRAGRISQAIIQARARYQPLTRTQQLVELVETVLGKDIKTDVLGRTMSSATKMAHKYLKPGGRAAVITFHSGEDQVAKRHFQNQMIDNRIQPLPLMYFNSAKEYTGRELTEFKIENWEAVNKHVIIPSDDEILSNPRSRSAKLRVAVKTGSQSLSNHS